MLEPIETKDILPDHCTCGHLDIDPQSIKPFYTHQHIELPEIKLDVTHFILNRGKCKCCGKTVKASVPSQFSSGYGPRLSAVISELSGSHGASIETAQDFCQSVLGLPISTGGIQRVIDRASAAINPIYHAFADPAREQFDEAILKKLQLLFHGAKNPPDEQQWTEFYSELLLLLMLHEGADDPAGQLARSIGRQLESLWVFLDENGVEPTNNRSDGALRFAVLWRKRSHGTQSDKGNRWVERILSLKQTYRMRALPVFPILANAIDAYFKDLTPDLEWVTAN